MEYATLTGCGINVSRMCLGTMTFGGQIDEKAGIEAVSCALDRGVNFFDTANAYTGGRSEEIMGKAMEGRRERIILATKVGLKVGDGPNDSGLSRWHIMREVERSLKRLRTDRVEFLYLHAPDYETPIEETLAAVDDLVRAGKALYVGASNFAAWQLAELRHAAEKASQVKPVVSQVVYNLLTRGVEQEHIPYLKKSGMGLVVYNPLAGGLLTEKYAEKAMLENTRFSINKGYRQRYWNEENLEAWDELQCIASEAGIGMVELAMRWLASTGNVDSIITGFSSLRQLEFNLAVLDGGGLDSSVMEACDVVWAGVSGNRFRYNR